MCIRDSAHSLHFSEYFFHAADIACHAALDADKEGMLHILDVHQFQTFAAPAHHDISVQMLCTVNHIAHHCTCSGELACAAAVEHGVTQHIAVYEDGVEYTVYAVERTVLALSLIHIYL